LLVFLGVGDGTFQVPSILPLAFDGELDAGMYAPTQVVAGDFNGDGFSDFAVLDDSALARAAGPGDVRVFFGSDAGPIYGPVLALPGSPPASFQALALGDLNHDGFPDVVVADGTGDLYVALSIRGADGGWEGLGGLGDVPGVRDTQECDDAVAANGNTAVALIDLNGDGFLDAVAAHPTQDALVVFLNDQTGSLNLQVNEIGVGLADAGGPLNVIVTDVNGDGVPDLVVADGAADENTSGMCFNVPSVWGTQLSYLLGLVGGGFAPPVVQTVEGVAPDWMLSGNFIPGQATPSLVVSFESLVAPDNDHVLFYSNTCQ
jgi:hypothetical protein